MFCIYTILAFFRWLFGGTNDCSLTLLVTTTAEYRQTKTGFWAQLGSKCMSKIPAPMCSTCFKSYPVITMWKKLLRQGDKIFLLLWGKIFGKYQSEIFTWKLVIVCTFPICSFAFDFLPLHNNPLKPRSDRSWSSSNSMALAYFRVRVLKRTYKTLHDLGFHSLSDSIIYFSHLLSF